MEEQVRVEDKIAIVLEELGFYDSSQKKYRQALKRAKKRIDKVETGEARREEESHQDATDAAFDPYGDNL